MSDDRPMREIRLERLARLRELGFDPFGVERFPFELTAKHLTDRFEELAPAEDADDATKSEAAIITAGRVVRHHVMGQAGFVDLSDGEHKFQCYFTIDSLGEAGFEAFTLLDVGDHLGVKGYLFTTKRGQKSLHVLELTPLSKSLQLWQLGKSKDGQSWYGLSDVDTRYRHRHLDLVGNLEVREKLLLRSRITREIRRYFDGLDFLEVETPLLQTEAGGASAKPFLTHYEAYDMDMKLRISLELPLKRIICGDVRRVYELGRVFRNEGVDDDHNPEFTLLEWYEAYANLEDMMDQVEGLFRHVTQTVFGTTQVGDIDFAPRWPRLDMMEALAAKGVSMEDVADLPTALKTMERHGLPTKRIQTAGKAIEKLFGHLVEPELVQPTFVVAHPLEISPLAKKDPNRPGFTRRFEGYVRGSEVCNAFSEINDPIDQRERFEAQLAERNSGDDEAMGVDEEFLYALECGMPPTGGCGIGIDRMVKLLTGANTIREILMFPTMKPGGRGAGLEEDEESDDE